MPRNAARRGKGIGQPTKHRPTVFQQIWGLQCRMKELEALLQEAHDHINCARYPHEPILSKISVALANKPLT